MQTVCVTQSERLSGRTPSATLHRHQEGNLEEVLFLILLAVLFYDDVDAAKLKTSAGYETNTK